MTKRARPSPSPPAPKKANKSGGSAAALPTASAAQNSECNGSHQAAALNATYAAQLQDSIDEIKGHPMFADIQNEKPLSIGQPHFTPGQFNNMIAESGVYRCAFNLFHLKIKTSTSVPIRPKRVKQIRHEWFDKPSENFPINRTVLVGVLEDVVKGEQGYKIPSTSFGELEVLSPEEILHAPVMQIADDIRNGMGDEELQKWRKLLLSIPVMFKVR